jgi:hypothetical protein
MSKDFTEVFGKSVGNMMKNVHTAIPATVERFDAGTRKVSAKPAVRQKKSGGEYTDMPVVHEVPVQYPSSSKAGLTFPLEKGDTGVLIFSQADIDAWCQRGGTQTPGSERHWDLTDAIFIPGVWPFSASKPEVEAGKIVMSYGNSAVKIGSKITIEGIGNLASLMGDLISAIAGIATTGSPAAHVLNPANIAQLNAIKAQFDALLE